MTHVRKITVVTTMDDKDAQLLESVFNIRIAEYVRASLDGQLASLVQLARAKQQLDDH